ncbi:probable rRNA maturation factor [Rhizobiales bacterium GAS191]|nr:probable rRNA maturation factor [Rhizobiales bacterium GAS191]SEE45188.1 probable rRNA maturation factor [Rhizobiales bacterium GAS188]
MADMNVPDVDILVESPLWERVPQARATVLRAVAAVAADRDAGAKLRRGDEMGVTFTDDAAIAALNGRWRGKDGPTNVLSFPAPPPPSSEIPHFLGDIVLAFETLEREANSEGKAVEQHLAHLVVHGFLHLLGHDHEEDEEASRMETLETGILATIGIADPY